jgi:MFS family permease
MSPLELRASLSLTALYALRMLGLFLILPVFAIHAMGMPGGDDHFMIGLAMGIYGLTQGLLQVPFGLLSDRIGRKQVIVPGLLLFALGSFIAAFATDLYWTIIGRGLQGAGAISGAVTALLADLTTEKSRIRAMALVGTSIGLMFALSMLLAPILYQSIGMSGIFAMTGSLALAGVLVTLFIVPSEREVPASVASVPPAPFLSVLLDRELLRLDFGIFALHAVLMALFVVVPSSLVSGVGLPVSEHWKIYLPVVLCSFVLMVPPIIAAERGRHFRTMFLGSIFVMFLVHAALIGGTTGIYALSAVLVVFFTAFNVMEALLPSMVARTAPPGGRGAALGIYNTLQSLGIFAGGAAGGALRQQGGPVAVYLFGAAVLLIWLLLGASMRAPAPRAAVKSESPTDAPA